MQVKFAQEFLISCRDEAQVLIQQHWQEIAMHKSKIKLNPNWAAYEALEASGQLSIFTARLKGELVGYFVTINTPNPHYKDHVFAANDVLYLSPIARRGWAGLGLIKFAERCLRDDGVSVMAINTKVHRPFDAVLKRLGFEQAERVYTKFLGDK